MLILDRYILKSVLNIFVVCLLTFLFLYVIIDLFANLADILQQKIPLQILVQYYVSYLPIIFVQVAPIACLLSTLYTFGKMNRDNEIIAMRAAGLSILQITKTVILLGFLISIFIFWTSDKIVPQAPSSKGWFAGLQPFSGFVQGFENAWGMATDTMPFTIGVLILLVVGILIYLKTKSPFVAIVADFAVDLGLVALGLLSPYTIGVVLAFGLGIWALENIWI